MSANTNKTMLVPVSSNSTDSLTKFNQSQESYSSFKNSTYTHIREVDNNLSYEDTDNVILALASNIFLQIDIIQNSYDIGSLEEVRMMLIKAIDSFTQNLEKQGVENSQTMLARYILCTFSDELIGTTYWGKENNWVNVSLLGHFYNETYGGDKVFQMLNQLLRTPGKYLDLLELLYVCFSLGFEGKYRIRNKGRMELDSIRENLYRQMKMMKIRESKHFYVEQKISSEHNQIHYKAIYQIVGASIMVLLALVYGILTFSLTSKENKILNLLQNRYNKYVQEQPVVTTSEIKKSKKIKPRVSSSGNKVSKVIIIKDLNE